MFNAPLLWSVFARCVGVDPSATGEYVVVLSAAWACGPRAVSSKPNEQTSTIVLRLCIIFRSVESITIVFCLDAACAVLKLYCYRTSMPARRFIRRAQRREVKYPFSSHCRIAQLTKLTVPSVLPTTPQSSHARRRCGSRGLRGIYRTTRRCAAIARRDGRVCRSGIVHEIHQEIAP